MSLLDSTLSHMPTLGRYIFAPYPKQTPVEQVVGHAIHDTIRTLSDPSKVVYNKNNFFERNDGLRHVGTYDWEHGCRVDRFCVAGCMYHHVSRRLPDMPRDEVIKQTDRVMAVILGSHWVGTVTRWLDDGIAIEMLSRHDEHHEFPIK